MPCRRKKGVDNPWADEPQRPDVKSCHPLEVQRQLYPHINKPAVRHVTAGDQQAIQMNDVTDMQLFDIFYGRGLSRKTDIA
jgi:hypothetical protein